MSESTTSTETKQFLDTIGLNTLWNKICNVFAPISHKHDNVYKALQTPVSDPVANNTATAFISSITQNENGVISAEKMTVPIMTGASVRNDGVSGLVPAPSMGNTEMFLKGDGSWATPIDNKVAYSAKLDDINRPILFANNTSSTGAPSTGSVCYESNATNGNGLTYNPSSNIMRFPAGSKLTTGTSDTAGNGLTAKLKTIYAPTKSSGTAYGVGTAGQMLKSNGTDIYWDTQSNATASTSGFMSAEDKTKLDDSFRKCTMTVKINDSTCQLTPIEFELDNGESTQAPQIGEKFRVKIVNNSVLDSSISMCAKTLMLKINSTNYYIKFYSDYNLNYDLTDAKYLDTDVFTNFPANGYIEFGIFKTTRMNIVGPTGSTISTNVYCAFLISNSYAGSISNISHASIRTDQLNTYNAPNTPVSTYYLPVLERGATGTTASNSSSHKVWTQSNYYVKYDTKTGLITEFHAPKVFAGSTQLTSDERLKDFIRNVEIDFNKLKQIPKKYFTWKNDTYNDGVQIGTSAQEVEKTYPELVNESDGVKSIDYSKLSIIALVAIDKLNERIEYLENKLKEYEQA